MEEQPEPEKEEQTEIDFFKEHENLESNEITVPREEKSITALRAFNVESSPKISPSIEAPVNTWGPSVKLSAASNLSTERKSTIGGRTVQPKRAGVSTINFSKFILSSQELILRKFTCKNARSCVKITNKPYYVSFSLERKRVASEEPSE